MSTKIPLQMTNGVKTIYELRKHLGADTVWLDDEHVVLALRSLEKPHQRILSEVYIMGKGVALFAREQGLASFLDAETLRRRALTELNRACRRDEASLRATVAIRERKGSLDSTVAQKKGRAYVNREGASHNRRSERCRHDR